MATSALIGEGPAVALDMMFLPLVAAVAAREIVSAGNRRNFKVLGVLALLIAGNAVFHFEVLRDGMAGYGQRIGLAAVVGLIVLIGGRIVPAMPGAAVHAWGAGALGLMTLAVMSRATLGHTGRTLQASPGTVIVYLLAIAAALARIGAAFPSSLDIVLLHVAALAWIGAFTGFAVVYGPMMVGPRLAAGPPGC